jgi:hypothetical protein
MRMLSNTNVSTERQGRPQDGDTRAAGERGAAGAVRASGEGYGAIRPRRATDATRDDKARPPVLRRDDVLPAARTSSSAGSSAYRCAPPFASAVTMRCGGEVLKEGASQMEDATFWKVGDQVAPRSRRQLDPRPPRCHDNAYADSGDGCPSQQSTPFPWALSHLLSTEHDRPTGHAAARVPRLSGSTGARGPAR